MTPEELRHAASPLPRPNGVGAVRLLVGGSVGHARTLALDAHARTLAYGFRDGVTEGFAVCPRARRVAEVAQLGRRTWLVVRNLPSLRIVRRVNIGLRGEYVAALACSDARARLIFALVAKDYQAVSRIVVVRGHEVSTIHRGHARAGAFAGRRAYLAGGRGLLSVDLRTGDADRIATEFRLVGPPAVSPSGSRVAARTPRRLVLFDVEARRPRVVATHLLRRSPDASLVWGDNRRLALLRAPYESERSLVFDASLRLVGRFGGWSAHSTVGVGGRLYGLDYGYLIAARLPNGPVRVVRTFGSPETYALAAVPHRGAANAARR